MNKPPDQAQRALALEPSRSILVQAPAGSGKTTLLTERFLRLLSEVEEPGQVVAITFTNAAAAEMRNRILRELEKAAQRLQVGGDEFPQGLKPGDHFAAFSARLKSCPDASSFPNSVCAGNECVETAGPSTAFTAKDAVNSAQDDSLCLDELKTQETGITGTANESCSDEIQASGHALRALEHSEALGWKLLDLPAQLRVCTIDSFCRELALQQPLLSGLGSGMEIAEQPTELYRRAARATLRKIDQNGSALSEAIEDLLLWRDNGWAEMEELLVEMLGSRDRWMHDFVLEREPDWEALRGRLERPFAGAVRQALDTVSGLLDQAAGAREEALKLARFACEQSGGILHQELAELVELPGAPFAELEEARSAYAALAALLLTEGGTFRKAIDKRMGFPADRKREKARLVELIARLAAVSGLEAALAGVRALPPARYSEEEWRIVRACFTLLRQAAGELRIAFAEAGRVDFIEVAQIAQRVLRGEDGLPTDAALAVGEKIRHLLVDEFQDTSRRQHQLLASLIAAWPERAGRSCFVVGDPMQSIYSFREADAELFQRVRTLGLEMAHEEPLGFDFAALTANFRTAPELVERLNRDFERVFGEEDGSGVRFTAAQPAREEKSAKNGLNLCEIREKHPAGAKAPHLIGGICGTTEVVPFQNMTSGTESQVFTLHLDFVRSDAEETEKKASQSEQIDEIIRLIHRYQSVVEVKDSENRPSGAKAHSSFSPSGGTTKVVPFQNRNSATESHGNRVEAAKAGGGKFRIAVLGRTRTALAPIAAALRKEKIPFRAVDLEKLGERPEVLDALALARALLNPQDRVAWLGVLRAPWCGLSLKELHALAGDDAAELLTRPVPELVAERLPLLGEAGQESAGRVLQAATAAGALRAAQPALKLGSWIEQVWLRLGGAGCVDATARANLDLLWSCLDRLPEGEADLLGPALDAALDKLTALPDPEAASDCGVQLMTIHKAKGLEFEVVIVPELQAANGRGRAKMLSWLERGLAEPDESGEITEFLIAPFQRKGEERGSAKAWVDIVARAREWQETRRILYVAATRAREELHFFARPACKERDGELTLAEPTNSLLATAWPALGEEVHARFEEWKATRTAGEAREELVESIAASGELLVMPPPARPTLLRRLPMDFSMKAGERDAPSGMGGPTFSSPGIGMASLYARHEGGLLSRALGTAVHALLEELARLRLTRNAESACAALRASEPRIRAQVRAVGVDPAQAARIGGEALQLALAAARDSVGDWILSPHPKAASEAGWAGVVGGSVRMVRVDRVFLAGSAPGSEEGDCWWIIDYKTAHADDLDLGGLHSIFAPQIEAYGQLLRNRVGAEATIFGGLYYPRRSALDWWEL